MDLDTRRPFTRADAVAAGISPKMLRGSRFRRLFRGVYVDARIPDHPLIRAEGALLLHPPDAFASHATAAQLWRIPVPRPALTHVTVSAKNERTRVEGIACHVASRADRKVASVAGVRVSAACATFVELASLLGLVDLVTVGDAMARLKLCAPAELREYCAISRDPHARVARKAAGYVRARVDSPMETRLRMLIVLAGLPEPEINLAIRDEHGREQVRLDLSYPRLRLAVEYDGRQHAEDIDQWTKDLERRERLDDDRWKVLVVTSKGLFVNPERTVERVHRNLRERNCPGLAKRPSDAWRAHFPGR